MRIPHHTLSRYRLFGGHSSCSATDWLAASRPRVCLHGGHSSCARAAAAISWSWRQGCRQGAGGHRPAERLRLQGPE